jgi:hypothetical protein
MSLSKIASCMGASGSTQSLAAASRMTHFDNQAYCMYAFPVQTICSQMACLAKTSGVWTGLASVTGISLCSSLLMSCPQFVPTYCSSFSHMKFASDPQLPYVHGQTHCDHSLVLSWCQCSSVLFHDHIHCTHCWVHHEHCHLFLSWSCWRITEECVKYKSEIRLGCISTSHI